MSLPKVIIPRVVLNQYNQQILHGKTEIVELTHANYLVYFIRDRFVSLLLFLIILSKLFTRFLLKAITLFTRSAFICRMFIVHCVYVIHLFNVPLYRAFSICLHVHVHSTFILVWNETKRNGNFFMTTILYINNITPKFRHPLDSFVKIVQTLVTLGHLLIPILIATKWLIFLATLSDKFMKSIQYISDVTKVHHTRTPVFAIL